MGEKFIVIGGGLIGASCAARLQALGHAVVMVDPGRPRERASFGNATMVANELAEPLASWGTARTAARRLFAFGGPLDFVWKDVDLWAPWSLRYLASCRPKTFHAGTQALGGLLTEALPAWRRLLLDIGAPDLLHETPHWSMWESEASLAAGAAGMKGASTGPVHVRDLASQEVTSIRREASDKVVGGVSLEGSAKLRDPQQALDALYAAIQGRGGEVIEGSVEHIRSSDTGVVVSLADGRTLQAANAVVAAGARSARLMRGSGLKAPLVSERGYHLQYAEHGLAPAVPPLIFEDRLICAVRAGDELRITGFTEVGRPDSPPDPRKWKMLRRHVAELGLPVRGEPTQWMGARPSLPDFLPAIGRKGRLLYAFGHQHIGLTLAAVTAEAIGDLADGRNAERLAPFRLERFH